MSRFEILSTSLDGLQVIQRKVLRDSRGYLERMFCEAELATVMKGRRVVQVNHTLTRKAGAVRGMHYQSPPHAELKLVTCLRGKVFDVAVDVRSDSPTFLQWHGEVLSEKNHRALAIEEGFAHGFQAVSDDCVMLYMHTAAYSPEAERGLDALDPDLGIEWPLGILERSDRDQAYESVSSGFKGIAV